MPSAPGAGGCKGKVSVVREKGLLHGKLTRDYLLPFANMAWAYPWGP